VRHEEQQHAVHQPDCPPSFFGGSAKVRLNQRERIFEHLRRDLEVDAVFGQVRSRLGGMPFELDRL